MLVCKKCGASLTAKAPIIQIGKLSMRFGKCGLWGCKQ